MRTKPIVALDVDGSLGDYHSHFLHMAELYLGKPMPRADEINPGMRLHKFMGVTLRDYRAAKLAYRQGGWKRFMPCYPGASELTQAIRRAGAEVWICTTRPYLRLDSIDPDTQEWLRRNNIKYDGLLYGDDKYRELRRQAGWRVAGVLEDLPELYREAERLFPDAVVVLRGQPYNRVAGSTVIQAEDSAETLIRAREILVEAVAEWKRGNHGPQERAGARRSNPGRDRGGHLRTVGATRA